MSDIILNIDFRNYLNHASLVEDISIGFNATPFDTVILNINLDTTGFLHCDMLLLIVAFVKHLKSLNISYSFKFIDFDENSPQCRYASRINFFSELNKNYIEKFIRRSSIGRFIEISNYKNAAEYDLIHKKLMNILMNYPSIMANRDLLILLAYCLSEIMDNVLNHSEALTKGWVVCQYFPNINEIRFMVCDTGIGIHDSLTQYPNSKYSHFTQEESMLNCVEEHVTNGKGAGRGLFHGSNFIKENKGELIIYSNDKSLKINSTGKTLDTVPKWQGSFVFLKIKTNVEMDIFKVVDEKYSIDANFDAIFGQDTDDLW